MIHIVFISDNNYVFPTKIAIKSLIKNKNKNTKYSVNIIGVELTEENINILKSLETNNIKINIICETNKYENIGRVLGHVSKAALFKFQIPNIFSNLEKILYLDGDILVEKDLSKLFNINLGNKYAAVVHDAKEGERLNGLKLNNYFNSGMMLLNLKKMREDDIGNKLLENKKNEKKARFMDQDSLNIVFNENVIFVDNKYNFLTFYLKDNTNNNVDDIVIFHMAALKPWLDLTVPKAKEFWSHADNIDILNILEKKYSTKINEINKEITYLKQKLEKNKKYPKWLCNFICCFIVKKKNRHHFRKKYMNIYGKENIYCYDKNSKHYYLNKNVLNKKIKSFKQCGINKTENRERKIIVSLTSFPQRFDDLKYTLYSLLNQTLKPDKVILWLKPSEINGMEKSLPKEILKFQKNGLIIDWADSYKAYNKLIPALKKYPDDIIITFDDDIYYDEHCVELLYKSYLDNKNMIHCHRAHLININNDVIDANYKNWKSCSLNAQPSFRNFATGCGGVLYPPHSLYKDVLDESKFIKLAPYADDIWFWAMAVMNDTKINFIKNNINTLCYINLDRELNKNNDFTLSKINNVQGKNNEQIENVLKCYKNIIPKILFNSSNYWEERYKNGGNSGSGSYNRLAEFKAEIINDFVKKNNIKTVIEFGCGDGNQLSLFNFKKYIGFDVSETILQKVREKYINDNSKEFKNIKDFKMEKAELSLSLDVIYHLIEDEVFELYMKNLFKSANKFVIIYSSNKDQKWCTHVKHRKFTDWIEKNEKEWKLEKIIYNKYPFDEKDQKNTSFADFYIFKKII